VLENYSLTSCFQLISQYNLLENYSKEDFNLSRKLIIQMVLSTDMSKHFVDLSQLRNRVSAQDFNPAVKDQHFVMQTLLHAADISGSLRAFEIAKQWGERVMHEFWNQVRVIQLKGD
jgi:hypothetical protein